ncbi:MAG: hypothetical protein ACLTXH_00615 [Enterobacter hormaechei]
MQIIKRDPKEGGVLRLGTSVGDKMALLPRCWGISGGIYRCQSCCT